MKFAAIALALLASACAAVPTAPIAGPDPADPDARVAATGYRSTIEPYESRRPVEPVPWRERNERVSPQPKR
jgi:hypothetical protein